jgi:hypothetical protein
MPQLPTAEYEFVGSKAQAAGKAVCPYCSAWHRRSDGAPITEACDGRYVRIRRVAIVVRGKPATFGAGVRPPTQAEIDAAVEHASNIVFS